MENILYKGKEYKRVGGTTKVGDIVIDEEGNIYKLKYRSEHTGNIWFVEEKSTPIARYEFDILKKV